MANARTQVQIKRPIVRDITSLVQRLTLVVISHIILLVAATITDVRVAVKAGFRRIVQSLSWSLYESVAFDDTRIISRDWSSYPIMRFASVPQSIDVHIIDRPGTPFLGTGEATQGPAAAALANALASATGVRIRELPLTSIRVKAAIGV